MENEQDNTGTEQPVAPVEETPTVEQPIESAPVEPEPVEPEPTGTEEPVNVPEPQPESTEESSNENRTETYKGADGSTITDSYRLQ